MRRYVWLISVLTCLCGGAAHAELGGKASAITTESPGFKARLNTVLDDSPQTNTQTVYELTLSDGTLVRQFARADGTVFAVSWKGHARPDLKSLFGDYFTRFQADNSFEKTHTRRRALSSTHADFVVRTFGGNGEVSGFAVLPKLIPEGFNVQALQ
jgi:hypothetical protein